MNKDIIEGNWKQFKGKVQQKWGELNLGNELDEVEGRRDVLLGKIQEAYGKSRDDAERELKLWEDDQDDRGSQTIN